MTTPYKVKAVYEYRSEEPDDLRFDNGQIITVTEDEDADWYTGEYTNAHGQKVAGIFPRNFVEKYEPAIPSRPARAPRKVPQPEPEDNAETLAPTSAVPAASKAETISRPSQAEGPAAHETAKEAEIEPPHEVRESVPAAAAVESRPLPAKKAPPPVTEKPITSSFKDRIAAFNKATAAPVTPFKPGGGSGTGFVKKPLFAAPPSRDAYVPPPREQPPPKVYKREDDLEHERQQDQHNEPQARPDVVSERAPAEEEDQPRETLKERIARLQQQQLESAQRQVESSKKKDKPKRPMKPRTESSEPQPDPADDGTQLDRVDIDKSRKEPALPENEQSMRRSIDDRDDVATPPPPSRELVSDTNDADDSGAADTEDPQDVSTEEERVRSKSLRSPLISTKNEAPTEVEGAEDTEEEEDPEVRRKRELRERMAKMSGGMGMMGMFGAGVVSQPPKPKQSKEEKQSEPPQDDEELQHAPPVPIMALPGMSAFTQPKSAVPDSDEDVNSAQPTPLAAHDAEPVEDEYISSRPLRTSTDRSQPMSPRDHVPPPLPKERLEPAHSPGARPVPPPPPPTARGDVPLASRDEESDDEDEDEPTSTSTLPPVSDVPAQRAAPPPLPMSAQMPPRVDATRAMPRIPMSPNSPQARAPPPPPPPPPGQPSQRRGTNESTLQPLTKDDSEDEVTEYDGDYDTDIASSAKHKAALKSHNRDSSLDEGQLSDEGTSEHVLPAMRAVPPPIPTTQPRDVPPLPPQTAPRTRDSVDVPRAAPPPIPLPQSVPRSRQSVDSPRAAPPMPPIQSRVDDDDDYDPYRYPSQPAIGLPNMVAPRRKTTEDFDEDYQEARDQVPGPPGQSAPPLPLSDRAVPPPPTQQAPMYNEPEPISMSGGLSAPPKHLVELGRSNSRRSADVTRPSIEQGFIASDVDLAQGSMWWTRDNNPPPALQDRNDVLWEVESSSTQKRGGRSSVSRDVYVLYQDYSQTTINATFDASEPSHVSFEQNHERPPMPPRKDQLESASESYGAMIAKNAEKANGNTIDEGSAQQFVLSLIRPLQSALLPVGNRAYGALVYANLANASTQQFDEIRPGDIITFRNAKFSGHKGGLHQKYAQEVGNHVGIVLDWDGTKKKIRVWEQGNQEKGKKAKVREESYRVGDLKSGEVRVWRVMPRSYVNWGTA